MSGSVLSWNRIADSCTVGCQARSVHEKLLNQGFRLPNGDDGVWFGSLGSDRSAMSRIVVGRWMRSGLSLFSWQDPLNQEVEVFIQVAWSHEEPTFGLVVGESCVPVLVCKKVIQILMTTPCCHALPFFSFLALEDGGRCTTLPNLSKKRRLRFAYQLSLFACS